MADKPNCENHRKDIAGIKDMKQLAEMIGDLHYRTLSELFFALADKLKIDSIADGNAGRYKLAELLEDASGYVSDAYYKIKKAYQTSEPFMNDKTT